MITKFKSKSLQRDYLDSHSFFVRLKLASYTHKNQIIITEEANFGEIIQGKKKYEEYPLQLFASLCSSHEPSLISDRCFLPW